MINMEIRSTKEYLKEIIFEFKRFCKTKKAYRIKKYHKGQINLPVDLNTCRKLPALISNNVTCKFPIDTLLERENKNNKNIIKF